MAMSAFGMLTFLLAVGLCVDISHFYVVKAELQNAADASSLAGASALDSSANGITKAADRAVETMNNFEFNNTGVTIGEDNVKFAANFGGPYMSTAEAQAVATDIRFVHVVVPPKEVNIFFASILSDDKTANLSQEAIAGMSMPPNVFCEWIPLSVIDDDANPMQPGSTYTIRSGPQNSLSPGNYQILAIAGRGGKDVKEGIAGGVHECAEPGHVYEKDTKPGVSSGPVRAGINSRFGDYSGGLDPDLYPPDTNVKENITWAQYRSGNPAYQQDPGGGRQGVPERRVVLIPMVKFSEFDNGRDTVKFYKFAAFFLRARVGNGNGGDIQAEYIGERLMYAAGGYNPTGGPVNPQLAMPVLYK
jgi:hypothetical protein